MYKHLLIPTDGSELSVHAAEKGVEFAASLGARITFLYVQPGFPVPLASEGVVLAPESRETFARESEDHAAEILAAAMKIAAEKKVSAQTRTNVSDLPYEMIIKTAEAEACDLVIMGSHGRRGLASFLLGSETTKVITHCKIPVLVYR